MTTIRQYVKNKIGGRVEYDNNSYTYQCVDLVKDFINEVYGVHTYSLGNASTNYTKLSTFGFTSISYNGNNRPRRGDIISFKENAGNGWAGHVGVCLAYDEVAKQVYVLEQNGGRNSSTGTGTDAIRIQKINFSEMLGWARYSGISDKLDEDLFDKIVHNKGIYIWEATNYLNKEDVAIKAFYFLAGYRTRLNGKNYNSIWGRGTGATTRQDLAIMIYKFIKVILGRSVTPAQLIQKGIWNGQGANNNVTGEEFTFMINKTKEVYGL